MRHRAGDLQRDRHHRHRRHRHQPIPGQSRHGHRGQAHPRRHRRRAHRPTRRGIVPQIALGAQAAYRLLEGRARVCEEARSPRAHDHGRYRPLLTRASLRLLQRGTALPLVRSQRGTAHRPRMGLGTVHDRRHQGIQARRTQRGVRADADQRGVVRHRTAHREGNGGEPGPGLGR